MNKPKIIFASGMFPPALGGPGTILVNLIPRLLEKGFSAKVATFGEDDGEARDYEVIRASLQVRQPQKSWLVFKQIYKETKKTDVIYALDVYTHGLSSLLVSKILNKPLILRFTGDSAWESAFNQGKTRDDIVSFQKKWNGFGMAFRKFLRTRILKGADKIITDCYFLKDLIGVIGVDTKKVTVINNATKALPEVENFDATQFKQENQIKKKVIMTQSRLVPWKGIKTLIEIMPAILERYPDTSLLIMGDGPQEKELKDTIQKLNLENNVKLLGKITDKSEKRKYYNITNAFVLNTFYEGMSNTLLEAMAIGKTVITTNCGGNGEFVNSENGFLTNYDDGQAIAKNIIKIFDNPDMATRLGQAARQTASEYTWEKLVEKNVSLIENLLQIKN